MNRIALTHRRAFALVLVLLALAIALIVVAGVQASAFRQAAAGRDEAARVRAYWAARAGLESTIARLEANIESPNESSAFAVIDDMAQVARGELRGARWEIVHESFERTVDGPADAHAKININLMTREDLLLLDAMTEDVADAILDWIDEDDIPRALGAESGFYGSLPSPYEPRNAPFRTLMEVELVAGVDPLVLRAEDWNLNGRLDPNEDDGSLSWPPDNADGVLDAGWSALITAASVESPRARSGQPRLDLKVTSADELRARVQGIDAQQAEVIIAYAQTEGTRIEDLIGSTMSQIAQQAGVTAQNIRDLREAALRLLLDEATFNDVDGAPVPGRVNINTVSRQALERLAAIPPALSDTLIAARDARATGYVHIMDLLEIPGITRQRLAQLAPLIGVESNAFVIASRGTDEASGTEVEIVATVHATALPVPITELRTR